MEQEKLIIIEGNPCRKERLKALLQGKVLRISFLEESGRTRYVRMNDYQQLEFSLTGESNTYSSFAHDFDYSPALEDFNQYGIPKRVIILDDCD